jgi:hypothetical protein
MDTTNGSVFTGISVVINIKKYFVELSASLFQRDYSKLLELDSTTIISRQNDI